MLGKNINPKIKVYFIGTVLPPAPAAAPPRSIGRQSRRLFQSGLLLGALVMGLGGGTYLSWTSDVSLADKEGQVQGAVTTVASDQTISTTISLEFDQSDLNIVANLLPVLIEENRHEPTPEEIAAARRKENLRQYLVHRKSPLAKEDTALDALLRSRNMKMMLAISFVESNMCRRQVAYNCSGIGGSNMRKYPNFAGWIDDFDNLLERRYKGLAVEDFIGYYVQPGSQNWVDGVYQILGELKASNIE